MLYKILKSNYCYYYKKTWIAKNKYLFKAKNWKVLLLYFININTINLYNNNKKNFVNCSFNNLNIYLEKINSFFL